MQLYGCKYKCNHLIAQVFLEIFFAANELMFCGYCFYLLPEAGLSPLCFIPLIQKKEP